MIGLDWVLDLYYLRVLYADSPDMMISFRLSKFFLDTRPHHG